MELAEKAIEKIASHEALCEERIRRIDEKLDSQGKEISFNRQAVITLYPFILGALAFAEWIK